MENSATGVFSHFSVVFYLFNFPSTDCIPARAYGSGIHFPDPLWLGFAAKAWWEFRIILISFLSSTDALLCSVWLSLRTRCPWNTYTRAYAAVTAKQKKSTMILFAYISLACSLILSHPARSLCSCLFFLRMDRRQVCDCRPQSPVVSASMVRIAGWRWWRWFKLYGLILCATLHGIVHKLVLSVLITTMYGRRSAIVGMCFYVKQKKKIDVQYTVDTNSWQNV